MPPGSNLRPSDCQASGAERNRTSVFLGKSQVQSQLLVQPQSLRRCCYLLSYGGVRGSTNAMRTQGPSGAKRRLIVSVFSSHRPGILAGLSRQSDCHGARRTRTSCPEGTWATTRRRHLGTHTLLNDERPEPSPAWPFRSHFRVQILQARPPIIAMLGGQRLTRQAHVRKAGQRPARLRLPCGPYDHCKFLCA